MRMDHNSMIAVLMAHRDGKEIECRCLNHPDAGWVRYGNGERFAFDVNEYRIKPEPPKPREESWLNEFHRQNVARQHEAFAPPHSLQALVNCVVEEVGELAGAVSGVTGEKKRKAHLTNTDVLDAVADAITYLSLVADRAGCSDLEGLIASTFNMVSDRAGSTIKVHVREVLPDEEGAA